MEQYVFYNSEKWYWFCKKEIFEEIQLETTDKVNRLLSEKEFNKLAEAPWQEVRENIITILNNK